MGITYYASGITKFTIVGESTENGGRFYGVLSFELTKKTTMNKILEIIHHSFNNRRLALYFTLTNYVLSVVSFNC
ncbi:hypothetical protein H5410_061752 [Solanum commersonii]|uniref:Uncharacterized protein n=1 Tax=Solanum commersonii TaxID=4109 RepID=A0A9J5W8W3_SOLCO|nr:hypothetical protein H5410_061752 [Solanum commersonii]